MPPYRWTCYVCGEVNAANTESCATCGFKAIASGAEIDRARAARRATGSIHGEVPGPAPDKYRTVWRRLCAGVIDALVFLPTLWIDDGIRENVRSPVVLVSWAVLYSASWLAYSIVLHGLFGQTVGKRVMGVQVLDVSESRLTMRQAFLRDGVLVVLAIYQLVQDLPVIASGGNPYDRSTVSAADVVLLSAGYLWFLLEIVTMLTNRKRRALHDFIAGSVVVRVGPAPAKIHAESAAS